MCSDLSNESELITDMAVRARDAYCKARCLHQRISSFRPGKKWNDSWVKIAKLCLKYKMRPEEFIEVQFFALKPYPYIQTLTTEAAVARYSENRKGRVVDVARFVGLQFSAMECLLKADDDLRAHLTDEMQEFDPLFKFVAARSFGLDDIAEAYLEAATLQYASSVHYDGLYDKDTLKELKEIVEGAGNDKRAISTDFALD